MAQRRWQDWLNLFLGGWLFVTPFVVGPSATAWVMGAAIVVVSTWALMRPETIAPEWTNVALGALTFIAPFVVPVYATSWMEWIVGLFVVLIAGTEIEIIGRGKFTHA